MTVDTSVKRKNLPIASIGGNRRVTQTFDLQEAIDGVVSQHSRKHWRTIVQEFGERSINLADLKNAKALPAEVKAMIDDEVMTLSDLVILGQFAKAITAMDTKAATFLRDTAGYQPPKEVKVEDTRTGLASLTDEELHSLLIALDPGQIEE